MKRMNKADEAAAIQAFVEHTGYPEDGCLVSYRENPDTGVSEYQVSDARGRGDGSGEWTEVPNA